MQNQIQIFKGENNEIQVEVKFEEETVWLTQKQMADLFGATRQNISLHIKNCYLDGELTEISTIKDFLIVRKEGIREVKRNIDYYNLDVIISVGYRVNSKRGVHFRQWATQKLKEYLVQGYAINQKRLEQKNQEIQFLHDGIRIMSRAIEEITEDASYKWLNKFSKGLQILDDYDHENLDEKGLNTKLAVYPKMQEYEEIVQKMKSEFDTFVFGKKKDDGFISAINQIEQGFGDFDIYPSIEEKAAMLLYMVIKNHAFVDGNKRIGAACFLLFLHRNELLIGIDGHATISNEAIASITLFVAASKNDEMNTVKCLIISLLNRRTK